MDALFLTGAEQQGDVASPPGLAGAHVLPFEFPPWKGLLRTVVDPVPRTIRHWECRPAARALQAHVRAAGPYDLIVCQDLPLVPYARVAAAAQATAPPIVLDRTRVDASFQDEEARFRLRGSAWRHRLGHRVSLPRLRRFERTVARETALQIVCAESDAAWLRANVPSDTRVAIVPNGVDVCERGSGSAEVPDRIIVTGCLDYFPNEHGVRWLLEEVWPTVSRDCPAARLVVAGRNPSPEFEQLLSTSDVELMRDVPDMAEVLESASIVLAPVLVGGGTRLKIVEAWAKEKPVIATTRAADGLCGVDGEHLLIRDDPADFASAIAGLVRDAKSRLTLARGGRELVERRYDWDDLFEDWWDAIQTTVSAELPRRSLSAAMAKENAS